MPKRRRLSAMIVLLIVLVLLAGCSSPTAPTPVPPPITPPVVVVPEPPPVPTPNPLLSDPRYDAAFYRQFAHNGFESPSGLRPLARWTRAPLIYLRTIDDTGAAVAQSLLDQTAAAIINTTSHWTGGAFGVAGLERGTETRGGQPGWITVRWVSTGICGIVNGVGAEGVEIRMNHVRPECTCGPTIAMHELGHALGYAHTDSSSDVMAATLASCRQTISARELFHARVAYSQPIGSLP